jgi:iron complex transport system substrate-binding protein
MGVFSFRNTAVLGLVLALMAAAGGGQVRTVRDDVGQVFPLDDPPRRIVSLAPNITEILFALGLGDQVVGVTRYCDYPAAALQKDKVGGLTDPSVERVGALKPDLVIAFRGNPWNVIQKLQSLRLRVFVLDIGNDLEAVPKTIEKIGRITQRDGEARSLIQGLEQRYQKVTAALSSVAARPKVFLNLHGMNLATAGRPSYLNALLERAKGVNIAGRVAKAWLDYSREQFIKDDPDIIVVLAASAGAFAKARDWFKTQAGFANIAAVRNGRIHFLDENRASRFGPRLYDAFAELARILHPEVF